MKLYKVYWAYLKRNLFPQWKLQHRQQLVHFPALKYQVSSTSPSILLTNKPIENLYTKLFELRRQNSTASSLGSSLSSNSSLYTSKFLNQNSDDDISCHG